MKLVFWPPSNSKRSPFEGMIPKGNSKNICSRLVFYVVMFMKICCMGIEPTTGVIEIQDSNSGPNGSD